MASAKEKAKTRKALRADDPNFRKPFKGEIKALEENRAKQKAKKRSEEKKMKIEKTPKESEAARKSAADKAAQRLIDSALGKKKK